MSFPPPDPDQQSQWGQPQPQPQPQWGQPPASPYQNGFQGLNPYESESTPILVTGILSLVVCGPIGIYAWIKGNSLRERSRMAGWPEPSTAKVGRILGIIGTIIGIIQVAFVVIWVVFAFAAVGSAGY